MHEDYLPSFLVSLYLPWLGFVFLKRDHTCTFLLRLFLAFRVTCPYLEVLYSAFCTFNFAWTSHQPFDVKVHICDTHPQLLSWSPVQVATSSVHSLLTIGTVFDLCFWGLCLCWIFFLSMIWANQHQLLNQVILSSFTQLFFF